MSEFTHIDLFSGIGGFALAARWAGFETVQFVEKDDCCRRVLAKNFPGVPVHGDIHTFTAFDLWERRLGRPDLLTGGFPCQPFSLAGNGLGAQDDRYLWPEMFRVVTEIRPRFVVAENVAGLLNRVEFDCCISDLEDAGYDVGCLVIPACAVNAPHRRDRLWIVADSNGGRLRCGRSQREESVCTSQGWTPAYSNRERQQQSGRLFAEVGQWIGDSFTHATHPEHDRCEGRHTPGPGWTKEASSTLPHSPPASYPDGKRPGEFAEDVSARELEPGGRGQDVGFANIPGRLEQRRGEPIPEEFFTLERADWRAVEPLLCRGDHGVSHRVDRLRGLGNAIVPQVAYFILQAIAEELRELK
jgi:DNA (cytosine-5)-methyltransferase 1